MDRVDTIVELICAAGVILTPFWLCYKLIMYVVG